MTEEETEVHITVPATTTRIIIDIEEEVPAPDPEDGPYMTGVYYAS